MKKIMRKIVFPVFLIIIMSLTMMVSSAVDEYEIVVSADSLGVAVDERIQLEAEVEGLLLQPQIEWYSSDESIAVVNDAGVVTAISEGEVDIIAKTTVNGEEISATYPVRVSPDGVISRLLSKYPIISYRYTPTYGGFYYNDDKASWQKYFGFAKFYDYFAPMVSMEYDHLRMFYKYDGQEFMFEFWKGHYGEFIGCELGLYHRKYLGVEKSDFTLYACAKEKYWPIMDMALYRQENEGDADEDYKLEFKREVDRYWWCTGFIPGELRSFRPADELRVEATLTFDTQEVSDLVAVAMEEAGFKPVMTTSDMPLDSFCQDGTSITFRWQNLTESQIVPGYLGQGFSGLMWLFGRLTDLLGGWIPYLLKL